MYKIYTKARRRNLMLCNLALIMSPGAEPYTKNLSDKGGIATFSWD